jgi:hypothetical protein
MDLRLWIGDTKVDIQKTGKDENILGACFAACLGVAEVFRHANGCAQDAFSTWYSLFDFQKSRPLATKQS